MYQKHSVNRHIISVFLLCFILVSICSAVDPSTEFVYLGCQSWQMEFDSAGYSDCFYWGNTSFHPFSSHEMLSGEWGAAIYYNGISTTNQAMWLTDYFLLPFFSTNSDFIFVDVNSFDNPNNSLAPYYNFYTNYNGVQTAYDTAYSKIELDDIEVRIDYEVVDLGDCNYSPVSFIDTNGVGFVQSDRYVLLKTYTIENISDSNITGLEFYQMLCGLSSWANNSSYSSVAFTDELANYTPYNSVHSVDNFQYDITQWGIVGHDPCHLDYVNFSSTIEPDMIENDIFPYNNPTTTGTYVNIMDRNLNNQTSSTGEVAGAMGWYLPDLKPNETTSLTLAIMFGCGDIHRHPVNLTKVDDVNEFDNLMPGDFITYTIDYNYPASATEDINNAVLTDYLPDELMTPNPSTDLTISHGGTYNFMDNTVTWNLGTLSPGDSNNFTLSAKLNGGQSFQTIENRVELSSDFPADAVATEQTTLGCWRVNNLTQSKRYCSIQDAINDANDNDVLVAEPYTYEENIIIDGKSIFLRSTDPENSTIINTTIIDGDNDDCIVLSNAAQLDISGFTITNGEEGIDADPGTYLTVNNCQIDNHTYDGIECGDITISNTVIENNGNGLDISHSSPIVSNCIIRRHNGNGIDISSTTPSISPIIENCAIYDNGDSGSETGLKLHSMDSQAIVRNNVIINNHYGVYGYGIAPFIYNCIIRDNTLDFYGISSVDYCCLDSSFPGTGNIVADPCFIDADANNFHISGSSPCKDAGHPSAAVSDYDFDGEDRVVNGRVDIGADEYYYSPADLNTDEIVNFIDYAILTASWQKTDAAVALGTDSFIDYDDLFILCEDWLWQPAWLNDFPAQMSMMSMPSSSTQLQLTETQSLSSTDSTTSVYHTPIPQYSLEETLKWLDDLWLSGELAEVMTEYEYLEFRKALENSWMYQ